MLIIGALLWVLIKNAISFLNSVVLNNKGVL